ncbi:TPA: hypothetical protein ACOVJB_005708 [Klebsiella oxytoca]
MQLNIDEKVCVAVICTGHVTEKDAERIPEILWNNERECGEFWISSTAYGWLFRLNVVWDDWREILKEHGISDSCIENLERLETAGYDWIHFQADAPVVDGLHHFNW